VKNSATCTGGQPARRAAGQARPPAAVGSGGASPRRRRCCGGESCCCKGVRAAAAAAALCLATQPLGGCSRCGCARHARCWRLPGWPAPRGGLAWLRACSAMTVSTVVFRGQLMLQVAQIVCVMVQPPPAASSSTRVRAAAVPGAGGGAQAATLEPLAPEPLDGSPAGRQHPAGLDSRERAPPAAWRLRGALVPPDRASCMPSAGGP
jgi:hypothetical protein